MTTRSVSYPFTFTPSANTLNLYGVPSFDVRQLKLVVDLTAQAILYAPGTPGLGYTAIVGSNLTLQAPMAGCQAGDTLLVLYDDSYAAAAAQPVQLYTASAVVSNSNPVPVAFEVDALGIAKDTSLQTLITAAGGAGASPPVLSGGGTGLIGWLRNIWYQLTQGVLVIGNAADGAAASGNAVRIGGWDGANIHTLLTDVVGTAMTGIGRYTALNVSGSGSIISGTARAGRIGRVWVTTAGSTSGFCYDSATVGGASSSNLIGTISNTVGNQLIDAPCATGMVIVPGTGMVLSVSFD